MSMTRMNLDAELSRVRAEITAMSARVEEDLRKAVRAIRERDAALATEVKADDRTVNAMQENIQYLCATLMAIQQPVAQDLRELVAAIRLVDNLERIGDYSVHLAKTAIKLRDATGWPRQFELLAKMGDAGCLMIRSMTEAWLKKDMEGARSCAAADSEIDALHHELMGETLNSLKKENAGADEAIKLIRTSGFLERLGDHVTNCCELVEYVVTGTHRELND